MSDLPHPFERPTLAPAIADFSLAGSVVLVTGAGRGIGRAIAVACAGAGADVALGLRDTGAAADLVAEIEALGRIAFPVRLDIAEPTEIDRAVADINARFGRIDILVNNVGVAPGNLAENVTAADFDRTVDVNLKGTFFLTQAVARTMIARKAGRIIMISSQAGSVTLRGEAIYCMTKAALNHLTRCLAAEWAPHGIAVNSVAPTFVWTDSTRPALADPDFYARTVGHIPLGRIGEPSEVAATVVFLASPAASLMTGANLVVDGGWSVA